MLENQLTGDADRTCPKCGARIFRDEQRCGACLLETGLGDELDARAAHPDSPRQFGDYELLEEIGRGAQGVVYRARQKSLNRAVALKVIALGQWASDANLKRFRLEAEAAASLDHPRIVPIYEIGELEGYCYFSMKLVEGGRLDAVARREPISIRRAAQIVADLARTVHYAHQRGILHRDIKPGNILLDANGEPHLTDFGLAKLVEKESTITHTMEVLGTPSFMAPEQARGQTKQLSTAADVYGLGAVLYQMLTGSPPFAGGTTYETIRLVLETEARRPSLINPDVGRDVETICLKCLEKDPAKRFASAEALAEDLERWLRHEPIRARPTGPIHRAAKWVRRNPATAVALTTVVAFAAAISVIIWQSVSNRGLRAGNLKSLAVVLRPADTNSVSLAKDWSRDLNHLFTQLSGLKTLERTQILKWEGANESVEKIGQTLGTSAVLLGELRQVDDRILLDIELVTFPNGAHVWSHGFTQLATDWDVVRSQIAREVITKLHLSATEADQAVLRRPPSKNQTALNEYYRARRFGDVLEESSLTNAIEHFEVALRHDPEFAQAYAGLADAHMNLAYTYRDPQPPLAKARVATDAALRIDSSLPQAKIMDGILKYFHEWDWPGAQQALDEALRLDVSAVEANACYLHMQDVYGNGAEALAKVKRAVDLHPSSLLIRSELGCAAYYAALFDEAVSHSRESLRNEPNNPVIHWLLARTLAQKGAYDEALATLAAGKSKPGGELCVLDAEQAYIHARTGETNQTHQIIAALKARERTEYVDPYVYAMIYAGLGDADKVFACLNQACDKRSTYVSSLPCEPKFAPYRSDSRYQQILARLKLPSRLNSP